MATRKRSREWCYKCGGSGRYFWGAVVNGQPTNSGPCYACEGKGYQTSEDKARCAAYWRHAFNEAARGMLRRGEQ